MILALKIQAGASQNEFAGLHGASLKIRIKAPAVEGRANRELIHFLAAAFGVPKANVLLVRGESAPAKTVRIHMPLQIPDDLKALDSSLQLRS